MMILVPFFHPYKSLPLGSHNVIIVWNVLYEFDGNSQNLEVELIQFTFLHFVTNCTTYKHNLAISYFTFLYFVTNHTYNVQALLLYFPKPQCYIYLIMQFNFQFYVICRGFKLLERRSLIPSSQFYILKWLLRHHCFHVHPKGSCRFTKQRRAIKSSGAVI